MGCGAAKEVAAEEGPLLNRNLEEENEVKKIPQPSLNPTQLRYVRTLWPAGTAEMNTPPLCITPKSAPRAWMEKVPVQEHVAQKILFSQENVIPPRILPPTDVKKVLRQMEQLALQSTSFQDNGSAATTPRGEGKNPLDPDAALASNVAGRDAYVSAGSAAAGLCMRAYFACPLGANCIGWARPNLPPNAVRVEGFRYDENVEGASDLEAIQHSQEIEEVSSRRRVLLFPSQVSAIGICLEVDGEIAETDEVMHWNPDISSQSFLPPIAGSFLTFDLGGTVETPSALTSAENSFGLFIWPPKAPDVALFEDCEGSDLKTNPPKTAAQRRDEKIAAHFSRKFKTLGTGRHVLCFRIKFQFPTDRFAAVYDRPAAGSQPAHRTVGSYRCTRTDPLPNRDQQGENQNPNDEAGTGYIKNDWASSVVVSEGFFSVDLSDDDLEYFSKLSAR